MLPAVGDQGCMTLLNPRDNWQCLEALLVVTTGGQGLLLAWSGERPGMQVNVPQCRAQDSLHNKE